jgi:CBS domain-containing protein
MRIASIVTRRERAFECIPETATLADAIKLMDERAIGSVGVVSEAPVVFRGLLAQTDVIAALAAGGAEALGQSVANFVRAEVLTCHGEDDAADIMQTMTRSRSRHAIVKTLTGAVGGLVSLGDLVAAMLDEARLEAGVLRDMARSRLMNAGA